MYSEEKPDNLGGKPSWARRVWLATPDWVFRALGAGFFLVYLYANLDEYRDFPRVGPYIETVRGRQYFLFSPLARVLTDLTFLLIALAFIIRTTPRARAQRAGQIVIPLIGGFWPMLPFLVLAALKAFESPLTDHFDRLLGFGPISGLRFLVGVGMLILGNAIDVWGYAYLVRSLSIVAEARKLQTRGPYRFVRHPIYLGQFISQAAVWVVLFDRREVWAPFYLAFVAMQLYRSWVEERVLEEAFGDEYRAYAQRALWFWPIGRRPDAESPVTRA